MKHGEYENCDHLWGISMDEYGEYDYVCVKCGLNYKSLRLTNRGKEDNLSFDERVMASVLKDQSFVNSADINLVCDKDLAMALYKKIKEHHPDIDDMTAIKYLKAALYNIRNIKVNNFFDRLKFTSSYDLEGRFKNEESRNLMLSNLKWINTNYPECKIVVNTILTKQVCNAIINNIFSLKDFMQEYKCWINLIPYIVHDKKLSATRSEIFKALKYVDKENPGYLEYYIPNMSITQEKWLYMYKDNAFQFCSCEMAECGHSVNFKRYSEKGTCFCCDLKMLFENN